MQVQHQDPAPAIELADYDAVEYSFGEFHSEMFVSQCSVSLMPFSSCFIDSLT